MSELTKPILKIVGYAIVFFILMILVGWCSSCSAVHHADNYEVAFCTYEQIKCFDRDSNIVKLINSNHEIMFAGDSLFLKDEFKYAICRTP